MFAADPSIGETNAKLHHVLSLANYRGCNMIADSNSNIAWHRVQAKKNRDALKALEVDRFRSGEINGLAGQAQQRAIAELKRKIAESERCIAAHERHTKRPLTTDLQSLARVSWGAWNANSASRYSPSRA
jgi:cell division septum initiation protein DivIVA